MRTVTFSDPKVIETLNRSFVCVWKNIRPSETFRKEWFEGEAGQRIVKNLALGAGATNICAHVATPDGKILHSIPGFGGPEMFLRELSFGMDASNALKGTAAVEDLKKLYARRLEQGAPESEWAPGALRPALSWLAREPLPSVDVLRSAAHAGPPR